MIRSYMISSTSSICNCLNSLIVRVSQHCKLRYTILLPLWIIHSGKGFLEKILAFMSAFVQVYVRGGGGMKGAHWKPYHATPCPSCLDLKRDLVPEWITCVRHTRFGIWSMRYNIKIIMYPSNWHRLNICKHLNIYKTWRFLFIVSVTTKS